MKKPPTKNKSTDTLLNSFFERHEDDSHRHLSQEPSITQMKKLNDENSHTFPYYVGVGSPEKWTSLNPRVAVKNRFEKNLSTDITENVGVIHKLAIESEKIEATHQNWERNKSEESCEVFKESEEKYDNQLESFANSAPVFVPKSKRNMWFVRRQNMSKQKKSLEANLNKSLLRIQDADKFNKISPGICRSETDQEIFETITIDTDDGNESEEFELWKIRESIRLKKQNEMSMMLARQTNNSKCNKISYCAGKISDKNGHKSIQTANLKESRSKMKFLQKYYHKGAYFQSNSDDKFGTTVSDSIYSRDFWASTPSDNFDKTLLPVVMQVKNFGRRGRTKWTHLVAEDTSNQFVK